MKRITCEEWMPRVVLALVLALATVSVPGAFADEDAVSDVFGVVVTTDGTAWPGVLISLTGNDGDGQKTVSDSDGAFRFTSIPPGDYVVVIQAQGKEKVKREVPVSDADVDLGTIAIE